MAREPGYAKYPAQITYSDTAEEAALIDFEAKQRGISKADVVRELIAEGRRARVATGSVGRVLGWGSDDVPRAAKLTREQKLAELNNPMPT